MQTLRRHWPEYAIEAALLGIFMISACVFATAIEHPGSPVRQAIAEPWLRRILTHNAADFVRRFHGAEKRRAGREVRLHASPEDSFADSRLHPADAGPSPSVQLQEHERELQLADALTRLPADYREVIELRNLQRLPFDEVAARMERSRPAAQMLWMRAIRLPSTMTSIGPIGGAPVPSITVTLRIASVLNGPSPSPGRRSGAGMMPPGWAGPVGCAC